MKSKILITGPPRCGKSTLISKLICYFTNKDYIIHGFLTPEIRKNNKRIGFDAEDINSKMRIKFARVGNYETRFKLGKYYIFIEEFEQIISKLERVRVKSEKVDLICIDEIGKMELFSKKFQEFIKKVFYSDIHIIATIGKKMQHPLKDYILNIPEVNLINLNRQNQHNVFQKIISIIS